MGRRISRIVQRLPFIPGAEDAHGNEVEAWGEPVDVGVYEFNPGSSSEPRLSGHDRVIVEPALFGPYDLPFEPFDKCVVDGKTYQVEGEVARWRNGQFGGITPGAVVNLRRVDG